MGKPLCLWRSLDQWKCIGHSRSRSTSSLMLYMSLSAIWMPLDDRKFRNFTIHRREGALFHPEQPSVLPNFMKQSYMFVCAPNVRPRTYWKDCRRTTVRYHPRDPRQILLPLSTLVSALKRFSRERYVRLAVEKTAMPMDIIINAMLPLCSSGPGTRSRGAKCKNTTPRIDHDESNHDGRCSPDARRAVISHLRRQCRRAGSPHSREEMRSTADMSCMTIPLVATSVLGTDLARKAYSETRTSKIEKSAVHPQQR